MKVNVNHPHFISFLDNVTNNILSHITIENYFTTSADKKMGVQYVVFKLMKSSVQNKTKLTDPEMKSFLTVLWKKNEESENYELAAILKDILNNFDTVNEFTKTPKRQTKIVKTEKKING
jgi:hypothetical protein